MWLVPYVGPPDTASVGGSINIGVFLAELTKLEPEYHKALLAVSGLDIAGSSLELWHVNAILGLIFAEGIFSFFFSFIDKVLIQLIKKKINIPLLQILKGKRKKELKSVLVVVFYVFRLAIALHDRFHAA